MAKKGNNGQKASQQNYSESMNTRYCVTRRYNLTFGEAVQNVRDQLEKSGFDIVSELDVKEYLSSKMEDMPEHIILMVCNRDTASNLMANDIQMSILFPCNVTVKEVEDSTVIEVSIEDTDTTWSSSFKTDVADIANKTKEALKNILSNIGRTNVKL
ncbi:Uncharacterized conserved protein, DUF302 family [Pricia antarctica]|uniref:Uncharacterized conserved protein, DUF302 family n=1 Tax=Pricia antarctica TaxID=641691 RepID=A0A1G6YHY8_9FLAO|nr:DUF302 domain-containing protein [Pricia antarctica]SDD89970.1 Uncharacterized conserved protein, DUF302 family [Pricia antarctica]